MSKHFHLRIKRSHYIPLFAILLSISFVSIFFLFSFPKQTDILYPRDISYQPPTTHQDHHPKVQPIKETPHRYSHLIINTKTTSCYNRTQHHLDLLIPYGLDPDTHDPEDSYVLVLGSGGLVGSALEPILRQHGYKTLHVLSRHHLDLRINGSLDIFSGIKIKFVFFLAYEVGGAKFLQRPELQDRILQYNIAISDNVFTWLKKHQIRYAFASSSLSADKSNYGYVKRLGENITREMPHLGRVFRLWNAYGFEFPGPKSHAIPDFVFQCLAKKKVKMLTNGQELRQFTHVNDISEALIAIMENFEETPLEVDISDGNWLTLVDTAKEAQKAVDGCELEIPEKPAKAQKRHEANLTSSWHLNKWQQKMTMKEGVQNIVDKMASFINRSINGSAVTFIINCGNEITKSILDDLKFIVSKIDEMNEILSPMRIEIIAASKLLNDDLLLNEILPCTILINKDHYLRKAVEFAHSVPIVIMDHNVLPTMEHLYFFQREIPRDLLFYFAERQNVDNLNGIKSDTIPSLATFQIVDNCEISHQKSQLKNMDFIVATKETWLSVKVPPLEFNVNEWLMRLRAGYMSIKFESPVWSWGEASDDKPFNKENLCCNGVIDDLEEVKISDTFIHYGTRKLIQ